MSLDTEPADALHWRYLDQYGAEVLCATEGRKPIVFRTVYEAVEASRRLGGCSLGRCLHAPMRWVLLRPDDAQPTDPQ
ncbi:MAG TPA: hypothetical protein VFX69_01040 [Steroidobacteraceae bacterium]|jgi:hypothetical protein|nr:hypothetical protein [Steroidobacteraceae bacterium]